MYVGEKSNARGLENFFFYPNQITHNPLKSQMVGSISFHAQEKRSTCFSMTTTVFLKIKKLVDVSQKTSNLRWKFIESVKYCQNVEKVCSSAENAKQTYLVS